MLADAQLSRSEGSTPVGPTVVAPSGRLFIVAALLFTLALVVAVILRAGPLVSLGIWGTPVDYDEGVYSAAAQWLSRGVLPYRDFVFVHPPGWLYPLAALTRLLALEPAGAFAASRVLAVILGVVNSAVVGGLAWRWRGPVAGVFAAAFYAVYPDVVRVERGPFLEPLLNLVCLTGLGLALRARTRKATWLAGAVLGYGIAIKLTGGVFLLAALAVFWGQERHERRLMPHVAVAAAIAWLICVAPVAGAAPVAFLREVFVFQLWRPPDGTSRFLTRLSETLFIGHEVIGVLAIVGVCLALRVWRHDRDARGWGVAFALIVALFLKSSSYWSQYNAFLATVQGVLAGVATATGFNWLVRRSFTGRVWVAVAALSAVTLAAYWGAFSPLAKDDSLDSLRASIASRVAPGECFLPFEPAWGIAANVLPSGDRELPPVVDPYGAMLVGAMSEGRRFSDVTEAFRTPGAQQVIAHHAARCPVIVLGWRGRYQLGEEAVAKVIARRVLMGPQARSAIDAWALKDAATP
ncbi:glycosyltransferase family 39 protein [Myxococcaceae bacterium JPH2]|nr:glycosyltransferase family 39 protein [Myxococcaceae bacterium JPH2]